MYRYVSLNIFAVVLMFKAQVLNMLSLTHDCTLAEFSCKDFFFFQIFNSKKIS